MTRDIGHHEQQIAKLLDHMLGLARAAVALGNRGLELGDFFLGLGENRR